MQRSRVSRHEAFLRILFGTDFLRDFGVRFWDGTTLEPRGDCRFRLLVNSAAGLRAAFTPPLDLNAGRAFVRNLLDVDGNLEAAIDALMRAQNGLSSLRSVRLALALLRLPRGKSSPDGLREVHLHGKLHTRSRDRAAIAFHYDQPVAFYQTFLDPAMVYSCGYFASGASTLDEAQGAKLDYVLDKLRLQPGERFLDVGCGWGALVVRAAQRGARALGITLSAKQYEEANRRIAAAGIQDRARVELRDYRDLSGDVFDKIASIGMVEHVGRAKLPEYFGAAFRALRAGGVFLNHGIAEAYDGRHDGKARGFIDRSVFPDGELVPIAETLRFAEHAGFEVRDVESLREHYAMTLRAWVSNLERNRGTAIGIAGEAAYRTWRLYMAGSAQGFASGRMGIFQTLLAKPDGGRVDLPLTRADLYQ